MNNCVTLSFQALDTLFFRESRPFEAIGGSELSSLFPPPPRTLMGAVRTAIGDALGANWTTFQTRNGQDLSRWIGDHSDYGPLALSGIWLAHRSAGRLYTVPLFLLQHGNAYRRLVIGDAIQAVSSPLGNPCLPQFPEGQADCNPLEHAWLSAPGLVAVLRGKVPAEKQVYRAERLFEREPRLGIARNNRARTAMDGLLYQSEHIRPKADLTIEADIYGLPEQPTMSGHLVRLGAEGRLAGVQQAACPCIPSPEPDAETRGLILMLMSPARFIHGWLPDGFDPEPQSLHGITVWRGMIRGTTRDTAKEIALTLHSAVIGKAQREGGWDMKNRMPRSATNLVPAGSAYYCTVDNGNLKEAIDVLHGKQVGGDTQLGRGLVFCGLWQKMEFNISGEQ